MKIFRAALTEQQGGDAKTFTGEVVRATVGTDKATAGAQVNVYRVEFAPGARTNWHTHSGPQWLFVVEGRIRIQTLGKPAVEVVKGDAVVIQPGEKHWHGAAAQEPGAHLAVNVNATTSWMEAVSEGQYRG